MSQTAPKSAGKTLVLSVPLPAKDNVVVESLEFRAPKFADYFAIGDPRVPVLRGDKFFYVAMQESVSAYVARLLKGVAPAVLDGASLRDTVAIKETVLSFFREAEKDGGDESGEQAAGVVVLSAPIRGHKGEASHLVFREPLYEDFAILDDPRLRIFAGHSPARPGAEAEPVYINRPVPQTVKRYAERLLMAQGGVDVATLAQVSLRDAMKIEQVILGFFEAVDQLAT